MSVPSLSSAADSDAGAEMARMAARVRYCTGAQRLLKHLRRVGPFCLNIPPVMPDVLLLKSLNRHFPYDLTWRYRQAVFRWFGSPGLSSLPRHRVEDAEVAAIDVTGSSGTAPVRHRKRKEATWWNTIRYSATSATQQRASRHSPGCPSFSHPTHILIGAALRFGPTPLRYLTVGHWKRDDQWIST